MNRVPTLKYLNTSTSKNETSINNCKILCYIVYFTLPSGNSSISIKTDRTVNLKIIDQDKDNLQNVVNKQKINIIQQRDSKVSFPSQRKVSLESEHNSYQQKLILSSCLNPPTNLNSIKGSFNIGNNNNKNYDNNDNKNNNNINNNTKINNSKLFLSKTQSNVSLNNNQESKFYTINKYDTVKTFVNQKDTEDYSKNLTQSNNAETQELKQQLNERDIQLTKIKKDFSKCQNDLQIEKDKYLRINQQLSEQQIDLQKEKEQNVKIKQQFSECQNDLQTERQQIIKLKEENTKLSEILSQKQIEMDQLSSKNNTFLQVIKRIEENISLVYQKEVKIQVKQI